MTQGGAVRATMARVLGRAAVTVGIIDFRPGTQLHGEGLERPLFLLQAALCLEVERGQGAGRAAGT